MRIRHLSRALVVLAAAAVAVAGCSSSHHNRTARRAASSATTTTLGSTTTSAPASGSTTSVPGQGPPTTAGSATASAAPGGCTPSQLGVSLVNNGVAAGSVIYQIDFHNKSSQACSLTGYPGIGLLDTSGHLLPLNLTRSPQSPSATVQMPPGADARFNFSYSDGTGFANPSCPRAAKMEVTAPNDYASLLLDAQPAPCAPAGQTPQAGVTAVVPAGGQ